MYYLILQNKTTKGVALYSAEDIEKLKKMIIDQHLLDENDIITAFEGKQLQCGLQTQLVIG